ncbi:HNH endonuclease [Microbacterium sp. JZ70]
MSDGAVWGEGDGPSPTASERAAVESAIEAIRAADRVIAHAQAARQMALASASQVAWAQHERQVAAGGSSRAWAHRAIAEEIAAATHTPGRSVERQMNDATNLVSRFPVVRDRLAAGTVSLPHARTIVLCGDRLDDPALRATYEVRVLERLDRVPMTAAALAEVARKIAQELDPVSISDRHKAARRRRRVGFRPGEDAMGAFDAEVANVLGLGMMDRIDQMAKTVITARAAARRAGDPAALADDRTLDEIRADIFTDLTLTGTPTGHDHLYGATFPQTPEGDRAGEADAKTGDVGLGATADGTGGAADAKGGDVGLGALSDTDTDTADGVNESTAAGSAFGPAAGPARKPAMKPVGLGAIRGSVHITIPATALADPTNRTEGATLAGAGPIPIIDAKQIAADATIWNRAFTDAHTGVLLTVDQRFPTTAQRRFLKARDERCRFPGCRQAIRKHYVDVDHTHPHSRGGPTNVANLEYLCETHHMLEQMTEWTVTQGPGGVLEWTSPNGRVYTDTPPPVARFTPPDDEPPPF